MAVTLSPAAVERVREFLAATPGAQLIRLEKGALVDPTGALKHPPRTEGAA